MGKAYARQRHWAVPESYDYDPPSTPADDYPCCDASNSDPLCASHPDCVAAGYSTGNCCGGNADWSGLPGQRLTPDSRNPNAEDGRWTPYTRGNTPDLSKAFATGRGMPGNRVGDATALTASDYNNGIPMARTANKDGFCDDGAAPEPGAPADGKIGYYGNGRGFHVLLVHLPRLREEFPLVVPLLPDLTPGREPQPHSQTSLVITEEQMIAEERLDDAWNAGHVYINHEPPNDPGPEFPYKDEFVLVELPASCPYGSDCSDCGTRTNAFQEWKLGRRRMQSDEWVELPSGGKARKYSEFDFDFLDTLARGFQKGVFRFASLSPKETLMLKNWNFTTRQPRPLGEGEYAKLHAAELARRRRRLAQRPQRPAQPRLAQPRRLGETVEPGGAETFLADGSTRAYLCQSPSPPPPQPPPPGEPPSPPLVSVALAKGVLRPAVALGSMGAALVLLLLCPCIICFTAARQTKFTRHDVLVAAGRKQPVQRS